MTTDDDQRLAVAKREIHRLHAVNRSLLATHDKMLAMLDRIHAQMEQYENWPRSTPLFDEIGCLIAEAKGEYDPDDERSTS